jgi:hypothetical protein
MSRHAPLSGTVTTASTPQMDEATAVAAHPMPQACAWFTGVHVEAERRARVAVFQHTVHRVKPTRHANLDHVRPERTRISKSHAHAQFGCLLRAVLPRDGGADLRRLRRRLGGAVGVSGGVEFGQQVAVVLLFLRSFSNAAASSAAALA